MSVFDLGNKLAIARSGVYSRKVTEWITDLTVSPIDPGATSGGVSTTGSDFFRSPDVLINFNLKRDQSGFHTLIVMVDLYDPTATYSLVIDSTELEATVTGPDANSALRALKRVFDEEYDADAMSHSYPVTCELIKDPQGNEALLVKGPFTTIEVSASDDGSLIGLCDCSEIENATIWVRSRRRGTEKVYYTQMESLDALPTVNAIRKFECGPFEEMFVNIPSFPYDDDVFLGENMYGLLIVEWNFYTYS